MKLYSVLHHGTNSDRDLGKVFMTTRKPPIDSFNSLKEKKSISATPVYVVSSKSTDINNVPRDGSNEIATHENLELHFKPLKQQQEYHSAFI